MARRSALQPAPVAVFDLDGVLVHGDVLGAFLRHRLRRSPAHLAAMSAVWPWFVGPLLLRRTRTRALRELLRLGLAGLDDASYEEAALAFAPILAARRDRVVPQAVDEIRGIQARGLRVVVATAGEERLAAAYVAALGLRDVDVVGSTFEFGRLGVAVRRSNFGATKVESLAAIGVAPQWTASYTDSLSDLPLLRCAKRPVLVNPDGWLRKRVRAELGRVADEMVWLDPPPKQTGGDRIGVAQPV